ncbi:MAG: response regulator [Chloroflexi bacterium]|nr:response regulator [Chloroflexota bacterium]
MKPNILYIEDNPDNMMLVKRVLQSRNYDLIEAQSGIHGLFIAETQALDLILLDINLPDIDGYEVARRLRASENLALICVPIIAITANVMRGDAEKVLEAGCDLCLSKPINIEELLENVEALVGKKE